MSPSLVQLILPPRRTDLLQKETKACGKIGYRRNTGSLESRCILTAGQEKPTSTTSAAFMARRRFRPFQTCSRLRLHRRAQIHQKALTRLSAAARARRPTGSRCLATAVGQPLLGYRCRATAVGLPLSGSTLAGQPLQESTNWRPLPALRCWRNSSGCGAGNGSAAGTGTDAGRGHGAGAGLDTDRGGSRWT